jgi:N-carbamoylputrescine amidase
MPFKPGDVQAFDHVVERSAPCYAEALGVPVALANRTGQIQTPLPGGLGTLSSTFPGLSQIVDSDGQVKAIMGEEEGVIVAEVELAPARKSKPRPQCFEDMWAFPMPWYAYIWPLTQHNGEQAYATNTLRRERALKQSHLVLSR